MKYLLFCFLLLSLHAQELFYYQNNKKVSLTPLEEENSPLRATSSASSHDYYLNEKQHIVGVDTTVLVKTKHIDYVLQSYELTLLQDLGNDLYLLQTTKKSQTLPIANTLSQDAKVLFAHPNFSRQVQKR